MARAETGRGVQRGIWAERIATISALGVLLITLAFTIWMAAAIPPVVDAGDPRVQLWLVGHQIVRPLAIALVATMGLADNRSGPFDARSALTCALFVLGVVLFDAATWAIIQASPADPTFAGDAAAGPSFLLGSGVPLFLPGM
jgi:hypothetical protein